MTINLATSSGNIIDCTENKIYVLKTFIVASYQVSFMRKPIH